MSAFLEEYGKVIVVIVVVAALIVLAMYFKDTGSKAAKSNFDKFTGMATTETNKAAGDVSDTSKDTSK